LLRTALLKAWLPFFLSPGRASGHRQVERALAGGLAGQVQGDDALAVHLAFGPVAQPLAGSGLDFQSIRHVECQAKYAGAGDRDDEVRGHH
jgi:hypothetical protein